ncbi:MAG: hypothetical protein HC878_08480 [Leptolyngbyaceae cyanobacterium SL_5_14]|nr:hypothetical protein [Leptolyngbyaceae cyanobacterium SL_5_14]
MNKTRTIPVPRRLFEHLCRITKPSLFKTALAYLLRGLFLKRDGTINPNGSAKASWIAQVAGISLRAAKAARQTLISIGWLSRDETSSQWKLNRTGAYFSINLSWEAPKAANTPSSASSSSNQIVTEFAPLQPYPQVNLHPHIET